MDDALRSRLAEVDDLRRRLAVHAGAPAPWLGVLRRQWRTRSAQSSVEIEGFHVSRAEARAVLDGGAAPEGNDDRLAFAAYARAMDHVTVLADDPRFAWNDRVVLDLHFDACHFQRDRSPGRFRTGPIAVTNPHGGPAAYVGPPADEVDALMDDVVAWLADCDPAGHVSVRAAMAHLHVVSVHPFRDGNGRISRIVQSMVLAREGPLAPEFLSIEEYLGRNTDAYYAVLQEVQGGRYQPERDAMPWVRLCIDAQIAQMRRRLDQIAEAGRRWAALEELVEERGWPERLAWALQECLLDGVDRASYAAGADVSLPTATNDLRRLRDAGLVRPLGSGRSTRYVASDALRVRVGDGVDAEN